MAAGTWANFKATERRGKVASTKPPRVFITEAS